MEKVERIKKLTKELLEHCHNYYVLDNPTISDAEYDKKFDTLFTLENEANFWLANSPTRKVQGEVLPYLEKVRHSVPMLSADKSTNIDDVEKFVGNHGAVVSYKLDGSTVVVKYIDGKFYQALSRGSGTDGENITHTAKMIKNLPMVIPYKGYLEIRGEAVIPWEYYIKMNKNGDMGHPRNVASGGLRQLDANEAAKRNIYFYAFTLVNWKEVGIDSKFNSLDFMKHNGFDVVTHIRITGHRHLIDEAVAVLERKGYELPTDGWCFEYDDLKYGESLGSTEHHDRRLYALKPEVEGYKTYFRGIEYNTCRTGIVSMTALFDPVEIGNTMVSRATLHNCDFFNALELGEGDLITVTKFNEIIPGIMSNETRSGTYQLIGRCPSCGEKLIIKNTGTANVLYCQNDNCPSRKLAQFEHFVSKNCMDIRGMSSATLETLISHGFLHNFKDIYHLSDHRQQLILLDGFGKKSIDNLLKSIEDSRNVKLENFIAALGIPNIGLSAAKTISEYFDDPNEWYHMGISQPFKYTLLDDFGETMMNGINAFAAENRDMIADLMAEMSFIVTEKSNDNSLEGLKFCITGSFNRSRDELKNQLEAKGAKFISSVSKNLDILFCGEKAGSKLTKAQQLGIKVADEEELMKMLG
mgnify:CR=1 FL=1